jgi:hypothetical protein
VQKVTAVESVAHLASVAAVNAHKNKAKLVTVVNKHSLDMTASELGIRYAE